MCVCVCVSENKQCSSVCVCVCEFFVCWFWLPTFDLCSQANEPAERQPQKSNDLLPPTQLKHPPMEGSASELCALAFMNV